MAEDDEERAGRPDPTRSDEQQVAKAWNRVLLGVLVVVLLVLVVTGVVPILGS